ncbi:MAG: hypothetical protein APR53_00160 [Methanoculleus sp. SDB]|nr:MAG: hypothetical protein APR53_00160 [Methanoculleus sp. SDB]
MNAIFFEVIRDFSSLSRLHCPYGGVADSHRMMNSGCTGAGEQTADKKFQEAGKPHVTYNEMRPRRAPEWVRAMLAHTRNRRSWRFVAKDMQTAASS